MGLFGGRNNDDLANVRAEQKWDYINLGDFKSSSCWAPFSYVILYISILISFAVYGVDTFTAVNLLAFSRWASQIKPEIPFHISKWIFAGCILFSFVLLIFRWIRAVRVIRSGGIGQSYLDPIAVRVQSTRMGKGRGWRRFLVFADLTKSKKGADYIALFAYFSFESWLRVLVAEGPRQAINGMTLFSVLQAELIPEGKHAAPEGTSNFSQFWLNIEALAQDNMQQALILLAMLFTFVIWVFSMLSLLVSLVLYLLFLWHHIPSEDGSLSRYCRRKIDRRLERIVKERVDKALVKGFALQDRQRTDTDIEIGSIKRQPTLPTFGVSPSEQSLPPLPKEPSSLSRQTTMTTLPPYTSRPATSNTDRNPSFRRQPTLPNMDWDDERKMGNSTAFSRLSDDTSPLVSNASGVGYSGPGDCEPPLPTLPPIPTSGTPLSLQTGPRPSPQGSRTPAPHSRGGEDYFSRNEYHPPAPPSAASRRTPGPPMINRYMTPANGIASPHPNDRYRPFQAGNAGGPPSSRSTPGPEPYQNFTRPYLGTPSNEQPRRPPPVRVGTAPPRPEDPSPTNQF